MTDWLWVLGSVAIGTIVFFIAAWIIGGRYYKEANGKLYVKHGRWGKWIDVEEHLKEQWRR